MFQVGLAPRSGCPSLPRSSEQGKREGTHAPAGSVEGLAAGCSQEAMLLYPGGSLEFKVSVSPFPPIGRGDFLSYGGVKVK